MSKKIYYQKKAAALIKNFAKRNIESFYCKDSITAVAKVMSLIPEKKSISWGGSMTLNECGILEELKTKDYQLLDRDQVQTRSEVEAIYYKALQADYYLMSSNAITTDGKLVNTDGNGNRLAALIYGPKNIIIIAGMNKVVSDEAAARQRIRNQAAPSNAIRLDQNTPCTKTGSCYDCQLEDTICCQTVITRRSKHPGRIKVVLVGEELGY
jgi:hypothetical protein